MSSTARDTKYGKLHQAGRKPAGPTTTIEHNGKTYRCALGRGAKLKKMLAGAERGFQRDCKRTPEESVPNQWTHNPYRWEGKR